MVRTVRQYGLFPEIEALKQSSSLMSWTSLCAHHDNNAAQRLLITWESKSYKLKGFALVSCFMPRKTQKEVLVKSNIRVKIALFKINVLNILTNAWKQYT